MNGFSIMLVFGSWGGVYIIKGNSSFRICLGFVALTIFAYDLEKALEKQSK